MPLYPFDPTNDDHSPLNDQPSTFDGLDYTHLIGSYNEDGILEFNPAELDDSVTDPNTPMATPMDGDLYNQL